MQISGFLIRPLAHPLNLLWKLQVNLSQFRLSKMKLGVLVKGEKRRNQGKTSTIRC